MTMLRLLIMAASYFFALSIFLIPKTGSSAEDTVFVQTGASVQLDIQRDVPANFTELSWENDGNTLLKFYKKFDSLENHDPDKVDFNKKTLSLTLKNMQKTDSGVYKAQIPGKPNRNVAEYTVTVIESSAEDTVFVQTGASVQLDIQKDVPANFNELSWENDGNILVKFYKKFDSLENHDPYKVDFNDKTLSLTLKNMQKTDSGVYKAQIPGKPNRNVAVYTVTIIDAVKAPVLTVISTSSSSDSCTVSFTCTGHDLTLNSTYTNSCCSPEDVTSLKRYTLILICSENHIICNHSNPVSWKTESTDAKQFCKENPTTHEDSSKHLNLVIGCVVGFLVLVMAGFVLDSYCYCKRHKGGRQDFNTDYDGVGTPAQTRQEKESSTVYYAVEQPPNQPVTAVTEHTIY